MPLTDKILTAVNWRKQKADPAERLSGADDNK